MEDSVIRELANCCETLLGITPGGIGTFGGGPDDFAKVRTSMARNYGSKVISKIRSSHKNPITEDGTTCTGSRAHSEYFVIWLLLPCGYFANWAKLRLMASKLCWTNFNVGSDIYFFVCMQYAKGTSGCWRHPTLQPGKCPVITFISVETDRRYYQVR